MPIKTKTWIVAKSRDHAIVFAKGRGLADWGWVRDQYMIAGINDCDVIFAPGWETHPRAKRIMDSVKVCEVHGVTMEFAT